jgi:hypothetical protein
MRIFFICRRVPFPPDRGDKIATFNMIRHLSMRHEVHVFCLGDGTRDLDNIPGVREYAESVTAAPVSGLAIMLRALKALIDGQALSVAALNSPKLHAAIQRKFSDPAPDLVIVYSCNMAQFAEHFPRVPRIMQFGDLDSLKWRQYAERSRIPLNWIYALEAGRVFAYERQIAHNFSRSLVHTEIEKHDFQRLIPVVPIAIVGNGVDLTYFVPPAPPSSRHQSSSPGRWITVPTSMPPSGSARMSCRWSEPRSPQQTSRFAAADRCERSSAWQSWAE